jgi:hypothetical protein
MTLTIPPHSSSPLSPKTKSLSRRQRLARTRDWLTLHGPIGAYKKRRSNIRRNTGERLQQRLRHLLWPSIQADLKRLSTFALPNSRRELLPFLSEKGLERLKRDGSGFQPNLDRTGGEIMTHGSRSLLTFSWRRVPRTRNILEMSIHRVFLSQRPDADKFCMDIHWRTDTPDKLTVTTAAMAPGNPISRQDVKSLRHDATTLIHNVATWFKDATPTSPPPSSQESY